MSAPRVAWHARWVLPIASSPIRDGAVVVDGDRIAWVGPSAAADAEEHEHLGNAVLLPGLVNAHTHLELTGLRGFLEGLPFRDWLRALTLARRDVLSSDDLLDAARLGVAEGLRAGITTFADCSASGVPVRALVASGARGRVYLETFGPDRQQVDASMAQLRDAVHRWRGEASPLVDVGVSPHAPYTVSEALFAAVAAYARDEQLPIATHVAESAAETAFVRDGTGPFADGLRARGIPVHATQHSPLALLERTGLLGPSTLCIHAIQLDADDIARLVAADARVVHCPISNAKLGQGIAPVLALRRAGVSVGLGSDSVVSNDAMDLVQEARQAVLLQSIAAATPDALSAHDALALATVGGAEALGLPQGLGTLTVGAPADLAAFRLDAPELVPLFDPAVALVHVLGAGRGAALTMVQGRVLVRDGVLLADDPGVPTRVAAAAERVAAWWAAAARP